VDGKRDHEELTRACRLTRGHSTLSFSVCSVALQSLLKDFRGNVKIGAGKPGKCLPKIERGSFLRKRRKRLLVNLQIREGEWPPSFVLGEKLLGLPVLQPQKPAQLTPGEPLRTICLRRKRLEHLTGYLASLTQVPGDVVRQFDSDFHEQNNVSKPLCGIHFLRALFHNATTIDHRETHET
jgi:hypothetical protein